MAVPTDDELQALLDRFVCVRIVQMWGVDLFRFQFDGSLTWAVFFLHPDGVIYGRYGSRSALGPDSAREISVEGFKKSLRGALALHERYERDRERVGKELAGKTGSAPKGWRKPEGIPKLEERGRFQTPFGGRGHGTCIHCHMVSTNELLSLRADRKPIPDRKFWPYPMPDGIGLRMDPEEMATVFRVESGSMASEAGLENGDRILRIQGQPILSTADIQWVLHNAGDEDRLELWVGRENRAAKLELPLHAGWRHRLREWRFINTGLLRQTLGFACKQVAKPRARRLGLGEHALALAVDRLNRRRLGDLDIRAGDVIVAVDGKRGRTSMAEFTAWLFREKPPGSKLALTLLAGGEEHEVVLRLR